MQFKAGYIVDSIAKVINDFKNTKSNDKNELGKIDGLLQYVSSFDVEFKHEHNDLDFRNLNPVLATLNNIITRGLPTRAPVFLEEKFSEIGLTEPNKSEYEFDFSKSKNNLNYPLVFELLHIIEPGLKIKRENYGGNLGSNLEWEFIQKHPFMIQILESQRDFSTINAKLSGGRTVDFCFTSPYLKWDENTKIYQKRGRIFEVDGHKSHYLSEGIYYDKYRDAIAEEEDFTTIRETVVTIREDITDFENLIGRIIYQNFQKNFEKKDKELLPEYSLIFIPLAVARIQKTLIEYFLKHTEIFEKEKIEIAIIERDFPCGALAVQILKDLFENINALLEVEDKLVLPEISLTIFDNENWVYNKDLHLNAKIENEAYFKNNDFDIIIDHSILRRSNIYNETDFQQHRSKTIKIRSAHYVDTSYGKSRRVYCADLLNYKSLVKKNDDGSYDAIEETKKNVNYFIQNIFRKKEFRDGQLPIISRALQQKPVIGLLPTGGGKSLTFQLPTFLQPGLCLVVDPIKSLMEDQVRVLKQNWIDCCEFINSNLKREERVKKLIDFRYGETMFLFVSPERFVINDFRKIIQTIDSSDFGLAFSYCVIDEVHCVSEWGHDFRTTYLMLGKNAQKYAKTRKKNEVTLIGLTATASFDVLADIERELRIEKEESADAVISIDNTIRPELFFNVIENTPKPTVYPIQEQRLKDTIGASKQKLLKEFYEQLVDLLNSIDDKVINNSLEQHFDEFEIIEDNEKKKNAKEKLFENIAKQFTYNDNFSPISLVFCPHRTGSYGVTNEIYKKETPNEVFESLANIVPMDKMGFFIGGDEDIKKEVIEKAYKYFLEFLKRNSSLSTMVCTKAFGMGIDKENIRAVTHFNFSSSPESYIQEAGRAGRDKAKSICNIIIDTNYYCTLKKDFIAKNIKDRVLRKTARKIIERYDDYQNRIQTLYYESKNRLINEFSKIGIGITTDVIDEFNQDTSIHEFFHSNSFKGKKTEIEQLKRLIKYNEGFNSTRLKILEEVYNSENSTDFSFSFSTVNIDFLFFNNGDGNPIGKLKTKNEPLKGDISVGAKGAPDIETTNHIVSFLIEEWKEDGKAFPTLFDFLKEEIIKGLNEGKSLKEYFNDCKEDTFEFTVPTRFSPCNLENILATDFTLPSLTFIDNFGHPNIVSAQKYLDCLNKTSSDFNDFIQRIEEEWKIEIVGTAIYNNKRTTYEELYYSNINQLDVSRMIFRLYSIGFIDDYTVDYKIGLITFTVIKRNKEYYIASTEKTMLKYLSKATTDKKIQELKNNVVKEDYDTFQTITKCVGSILDFTYKDIVAKRKDAIREIFNFIKESKEKADEKENPFNFKNYWFNRYLKDELYYYFNAKYARKGFKIGNEDYSLTDDTDAGKISKWDIFERYSDVINSQNRFISECKMMRGSCKRIWRVLNKEDYDKNEFVLKLLYSYSTFGMNNPYYYQEAQERLIEGFSIYYKVTKSYTDLKEKLSKFEDKILKSTNNKDFVPYLETAKQYIMMRVNLEFTKDLNEKLQKI